MEDMFVDTFLSDAEINELIAKIKTHDNAAWERLCDNFARYIHECCWKRLRKLDMTDAVRRDLEEDLYMAGWNGFVSAVKNYVPEKVKFLTYATHYIDGDISKELDILFNPLGLTERPDKKHDKRENTHIERVSLEYPESAGFVPRPDTEQISLNGDAPDRGKYSAERRTIQILDILKKLSDEHHSMSKEQLMNMLKLYRIAKYDNGVSVESPNTITSTLESILLELNPLTYNENHEKAYRVKYDGYKEDRLKKKINKENSGKMQDITAFSYVHTFTDSEMDKLIQQICFSDILSMDEKTQLVEKIISTASEYYRTPFWDGEKLRFNPKAVHGRFSGREMDAESAFAENVKIIQFAINNLARIRFTFNRYTSEKKTVPSSQYIHMLNPYHLVVYHDNYYCIGLKAEDKRIWHYRVDLMSDVEIVRDEDGEIIPIEMCGFEGMPVFNANWNPEKYMAEHLYMAYDEPEDIQIKIKNTDYTIIHDWFGEHYDKMGEVKEKDDNGDEVVFDIVKVKTSPSMIVHWAMQYGARVEIMDEKIRGKIKEQMQFLMKIYG